MSIAVQPEVEPAEISAVAGSGKPTSYLRRVLRRPGAWLSLAWLLAVVAGSVFASFLAPYDPLAQDLTKIYALPSAEHWLGTDALGRDVLSRLMHGGLTSLLGSGEAVAVALVIGVPLGLVAGYRGGFFAALINRVAEALMSLPAIIVLLAVVAVYGRSFVVSMTALGVILSSVYIRLVGATTAAVRTELYVDAARVAGLRNLRIVVRHVLPNVTAPLLIQSSLALGTALLVQSGLGFLGLGPQPPAPNWGSGIAEAAVAIYQDRWLMVPTGAVLVLTVLAFNYLGDALRDESPLSHGSGTVRPMARKAPQRPAAEVASEQPAEGVVLSVRDLVVSFPSENAEVCVVDGASFDVRAGETVGLVGESGCGKTVTALSILGLLAGEGRVSRGAILFHGKDLSRMPDKQLATYRGKRIGYIAQEPMVALDPSFTIGSQLREPLQRHRGLSRAEARERGIELLRLVGIPRPESVYRSFPHQLSGGMAQRAAIAIALTGEPELLIADEPTTALDVTVQAEILDLLRSLREKLGMALIVVTHDLGVVADICDRAVVMYAGQVVEDQRVEGLFAGALHPYTRGLLRSTPTLDDSEGSLPTIEGTVPRPQDWPHGCRFAPRCELAVDDCSAAPVPMLELGTGRSRCIRVENLEEVNDARVAGVG